MRYISLKLTFKSEAEIFFPLNPVNTFRGAMGYALRHISCIQRKSDDKYACNTCKLAKTCAYALCYETNISHLKIEFEKFKSFEIPHLMNIDSGFPGNTVVKAGESYSFNVRLLGNAVTIAPYIIVAAQNAAIKGIRGAKAELESIVDEFSGRLIWSKKNENLVLPEIEDFTIQEPNWKNTENCELKLNLVTPVAFKNKQTGRITREPDFNRIIGSLMRRYTFFEASEGRKLNWHFREISELAKQVKISGMNIETVCWERYSTRQKQRIPVSGVIGTVNYIGPVAGFEELLNAGEILRCGRSITLGQGRINVARIRHLSNRDHFDAFCPPNNFEQIPN